MGTEERISEFAFKVAKKVDRIIEAETSNITRKMIMLEDKITNWYINVDKSDEFAEHFNIDKINHETHNKL